MDLGLKGKRALVTGASKVEAGARRATRPLSNASLKSVCFGWFIYLRAPIIPHGLVDSARAKRTGGACIITLTAAKVVATEGVIALGVLRAAATLLQGMADDILAHTAAGSHPLFIRIADSFAFVRLRRIIRSNVRGDLTYFLPVYSFNQKLGVVLDGYLNSIRYLKYNRMRKTQTEIQFRPLHLSPKTDPLDLQRFLKSLVNPGHHIIDEASGKAVQSFHRSGFRGPVQ